MKNLLVMISGILTVIGGAVISVWLGLYLMLYKGIMQAVNNWGTNNSEVVWGIIRAVFFEFGTFPGILLIYLGLVICIYALSR